jgi:polyphosphate kinase
MFAHTDLKEAPWHVVDADDKKTARLNLISHLLSSVPYQDVPYDPIKLPPRQRRKYTRPPVDSQSWVPLKYVSK